MSERALEKGGSAEKTVGRFETEILTEENNLEKITDKIRADLDNLVDNSISKLIDPLLIEAKENVR